MNRGAVVRPTALGLVWLACGLAGWGSPTSAQEVLPEGSGLVLPRPVDYCTALALSPWPRTAPARRELLHRFEILRPQCLAHAPFLAALGALWLENGEPEQALLWLERALMLSPEHLGAQADHALALAALGDSSAREALVQLWRDRPDVPLALRQRLMPETVVVNSGNGRPKVQMRPDNTVDGWVFYREASWLAGYESNLDHSPKLNELTLTPPNDPPLTLPVEQRPRKGAAMVADLSWQLAYSPRTGMIVQSGVQGSARHSPSESGTDWHHLQWASGISQQWGQWRGQLHFSVARVGGELNEAYRLERLGVSVDREAIGCSHRFGLEGEARAHQASREADGRTVGGTWSTQCPWPGSASWGWGLAGRYSLDTPRDPTRVGGSQRHTSLGLRLFGLLGTNGMRLDAGLRSSLLVDSVGYSPLLSNNAIRRLNQTQLSVELAYPLRVSWMTGLEAVGQLQLAKQSSNLTIFRYRGLSAYSGLRWRW